MSGTEETLAVYLRPGQLFSGHRHALIETILGSCVALTMFHRASRCAAICHAVMPACSEKGECTSLCGSYSRYTECVIRRMGEWFFRQGIGAGYIEVKLFGGSDGLRTSPIGTSLPGVGRRNVQQALDSIERQRLLLKASDVGGIEGRKLLFDTNTGEVMVKRLGGSGIYKISDFHG